MTFPLGLQVDVKGEFTQTFGVDEGVPAVLRGFTVIVPVAFTVPQPPVSRML